MSKGGEKKGRRGFASMDKSKQKAIASKGGKAAHAKGKAHEFDSEEARRAGRRGGLSVSKDKAHMAAIGKKGGEKRGENARKRFQPQGTETGRIAGSITPVEDVERTPEAAAQGDEQFIAPGAQV